METTQIYDILLTLLNNGNDKLFNELGVSDIPLGLQKLQNLDVAGVRDLYEACRPTPKPRKTRMAERVMAETRMAELLRQVWNIREARPIRVAIREKVQRTPSAIALHNYHDKCKIKSFEHNITTHLRWGTSYMPTCYNEFFHTTKGEVMPKRKQQIFDFIRQYSNMKKVHPRYIDGERNIRISYKPKRDMPYRGIVVTDCGLYELLTFMYDKEKNGIANLFSKSCHFKWQEGFYWQNY